MGQLLEKGNRAPDFTLKVTADQNLTLSELKGQPVILMFYPADFSPVCSDEVGLFNEILPEFHKLNAQLLGISVDGPWCHLAFKKIHHIHFPLLADFEPKGSVSKKYGAYRDKEGICERALFVIDPNGEIIWNYLSPIGENPGADGVLEVLENLQVRK